MVEFQPEQKEIDPTPVPVEKVEEKEEPLPEQPSEAMLPPKPEAPPEPPHEEVPDRHPAADPGPRRRGDLAEPDRHASWNATSATPRKRARAASTA